MRFADRYSVTDGIVFGLGDSIGFYFQKEGFFAIIKSTDYPDITVQYKEPPASPKTLYADLLAQAARMEYPAARLKSKRKRFLREYAYLLELISKIPTSLVQVKGVLLNQGIAFQDFPLRILWREPDAAFRNLISEAEIQRMKDSLGSPNLSLNEMIPFDGEPVALRTPTFEGREGKKFRRILQSS